MSSRLWPGGGSSSVAAAGAASALPELLELSVILADAVRCPGTALRGSLTVSVPNRRSLKVLACHTGAGGMEGDEEGQEADTPQLPPAPRLESLSEPYTPANNDTPDAIDAGETRSLLPSFPPSSTGPSPLAAASLLLQPLARPFPFELKLQLMSKCVYDPSKLSVSAMRRFAAHASGPNAFRVWSTKVVSWTVSKDECNSMPRTYEFRVSLPDCLPPSFRGVAIKHVYYLNVLGVLDGKKIADVKIPFRVRVANQPPCGVVETPVGLVSQLQHCLACPAPPRFPTPLSASSEPVARFGGLAHSTSSPLSLALPPPQGMTSNGSEESLSLLGAPPREGVQSASPNGTTGRTLPAHLALPSISNGVLVSTINGSSGSNGSAHSSHPFSSLGSSLSRPGASSLPASPPSSHSDVVVGGGGGGLHLHPATPLEFNISKSVVSASTGIESSAHVVKLTLDNRYTRPGDTVRGHLDFSAAELRCYRITIRLEQHESVQEDFALPAAAYASAASSSSAASSALTSSSSPSSFLVSRRPSWHFHQYAVNTLSTHFTFSLPADAVANFATDLVRQQWVLRFMFVTDVNVAATDAAGGAEHAGSQAWSFLPAPSSTKAEALYWTLPLTVLPHDEEEALRQRILRTVLFSPNPIP